MENSSISENHSNECHLTRRFFLGPLPEKVISTTEASSREKRRKFGLFHAVASTESSEDDSSSPRVLPPHFAYKYYLEHGGRAEDWGTEQEERLRDELKRKWKETEWGKIRTQRRQAKHSKNAQQTRWVGSSFEVGAVLGVNLLATVPGSLADSAKSLPHSISTPGTYITAATTLNTQHSNGAIQEENDLQPSPSSDQNSTSNLLRPGLSTLQNGSQSKAKSDIGLRRPILKLKSSLRALSDPNTRSALDKGKTRAVRYAPSVSSSVSSIVGAAPPSEVLGRRGDEVAGTSAGATVVEAPPAEEVKGEEVFMRDRMLVRVCYTPSESLVPPFDEARHRTTDGLQHRDWAEFMVVWRKRRLELYEDYDIPGKAWFTGHSCLSYVIPIMSSKTKLTMYSFVDMTFSITCPPINISRSRGSKTAVFRREKEGTNVFIFNVKTRSRAVDWFWNLWRQMGNQLPQQIEVHNPRLDTRIRIEIPFLDESRARVLSKENLLALCMKALRSIPDGENILSQILERGGRSLQLGWRLGTHLDWLWLDDDIFGNERPWSVVSGLAMKQASGTALLEIRVARHIPNFVQMSDRTRLPEPPAIEGYLNRIKPNTQMKYPVYLATHNGNIFSIPPSRAHPPSPPGLENHDTPPEILRELEVQRGGNQIMDAFGVSDLRSILVVRRAFSPHIEPTHNEREVDDDQWEAMYTQVEGEENDDHGDEGGDEGLNKASDKTRMRVRRSFELLMKNGRVVRFEAHSCRIAVEWINRLRALILYWKHRHREDAREEMHLGESVHPLLTPHLHAHRMEGTIPPEPPVDLRAPIPALGQLYNWCTVEGCRPIVRGGNVFVRAGLRGQYKAVQMFLVSGNLFFFRIAPRSLLHTAAKRKVNLTDAYISSGYFAALVLPSGQFNPNNPVVARRYTDGLEANDSEEDTLIAIWYHPQTPTVDEKSKEGVPVPPLSAKRKTLLIKTRSKLERDGWRWALNIEIEKLARAQKEREERLRQTGTLVECF